MANTEFENQLNDIESVTVNALQDLVELEVPDYGPVEAILENVIGLVEYAKNIPYGTKSTAFLRLRQELEERMDDDDEQLDMEGHIKFYFERFCNEENMEDRSVNVPLSSIAEVCEDLADFDDGELYPSEDYESRQDYVDAATGEIFWSFVMALAIITKNHFDSVAVQADSAVQNSVLNNVEPIASVG